jgi:poly(hydroxyalkanoate) granule-associated protein
MRQVRIQPGANRLYSIRVSRVANGGNYAYAAQAAKEELMATKRKSRKAAPAAGETAEACMLQMLHQVWLAGLGAVSKAQHGAPKLLDELITEGARVDAQARGAARKAVRGVLSDVQAGVNARMSQVRGQAAEAMDNLETIFRTRVHRALTQIGVPTAESVTALSRRVDALNANIDKLARQRARGAAKARGAAAQASAPLPAP